jgi:hypothetical protein
VLDPGIALLKKPLTPGALQRRVREVLDDTGPELKAPGRDEEQALGSA